MKHPRPLQPRLLAFGNAVGNWADRLPRRYSFQNTARQLVRSSISPAHNYAEALAAQSRQDFIHKMHICLKELRETSVGIAAVRGYGHRDAESLRLLQESGELIAIFTASLNTLKRNDRTSSFHDNSNGKGHDNGN